MWFELKLLIRYAWVIDPATGLNTMTNLLIEDGKIVKVGGGPMQADQVIDAAGLVAAPGLVDMHVHLREPGFAYKETVATGCAAAARGGVTTLVAMANTKPVTDSPELVRLVVEKAAPTGVTVLPVGAVTKGLGGAELTDFAALKQAGAPALSDDGVPIQDEKLLRQAMEAAKAVAIPGTSEHQLGLAVDLVDANMQDLTSAQESTETQKWLMANSWRYGFIHRYPNGKTDITGIIYEPWHYRYVGKDAAQEIFNRDITLEEYLGKTEH